MSLVMSAVAPCAWDQPRYRTWAQNDSLVAGERRAFQNLDRPRCNAGTACADHSIFSSDSRNPARDLMPEDLLGIIAVAPPGACNGGRAARS